ncbi:MAG: hypothetical protein ACREMR_10000 [Gemmatimonadales bacterium]
MGGAGAAAALLLALPAAAQVVPNRATEYLHPSDVSDARAVWLNPAGLAVRREASVHADLTAGDPGSHGRLNQVTAGFSSRGIAVAYQWDRLAGASNGHTYRIGWATSTEKVGFGFAGTVYRGDTKASGFDLGVLYTPRSDVTLSAAVASIGQPRVRGVQQPVTLTPSITLRAFGGGAAVSAQARLLQGEEMGLAFGLRAGATRRLPVGILVRLDSDGSLRRAGFAFGLSWGARDQLGAVVTTPGDVSNVDAAGVYGVASRDLER